MLFVHRERTLSQPLSSTIMVWDAFLYFFLESAGLLTRLLASQNS
jgi:hypothetical protein